jgi:hypothetical protein
MRLQRERAGSAENLHRIYAAAKTLGFALPEASLLRADEVIE